MSQVTDVRMEGGAVYISGEQMLHMLILRIEDWCQQRHG